MLDRRVDFPGCFLVDDSTGAFVDDGGGTGALVDVGTGVLIDVGTLVGSGPGASPVSQLMLNFGGDKLIWSVGVGTGKPGAFGSSESSVGAGAAVSHEIQPEGGLNPIESLATAALGWGKAAGAACILQKLAAGLGKGRRGSYVPGDEAEQSQHAAL